MCSFSEAYFFCVYFSRLPAAESGPELVAELDVES
jgi:hypothetical protein